MLATICASLANFLKLPESDLSLLDVIGEGDENNNLEDDRFSGDTTTDTESTTASVATADTGRTSVTTASSTGGKSKPKKKVAEAWDETLGDDPSREELERGFLNVYKAMTKLRGEFDTKFRKIFA